MNHKELNRISGIILDSAIEVHKQLGPSLLESVYEICLFKELRSKKLYVERQVPIPKVKFLKLILGLIYLWRKKLL